MIDSNGSTSGRYKRNRLIRLGAFQDDVCFFCDQPLVYLDPHKSYLNSDPECQRPDLASVDHYHNRHEGGGGCKENLVIAHRLCNSKKGRTPAGPYYDEKLNQLNARRGYIGDWSKDDLSYKMRPDQFGPSTPALVYLCNLANDEPGKDGSRLRRRLTKLIQEHTDLLNSLSPIPNASFRTELVLAVRERRKRLQGGVELSYPFDTLVENVISTMTKRRYANEP